MHDCLQLSSSIFTDGPLQATLTEAIALDLDLEHFTRLCTIATSCLAKLRSFYQVELPDVK